MLRSVTEVMPVKLVPVIVTDVPTGPLVGEKPEIVGAGTPLVTVYDPALVPVPPGVVTAIFPVVAPEGTVAVSCTSDPTENGVAATPLNLTAVAPVKPEPLTVTEVPGGPEVGVKPVTDAAPQLGHLKWPIRVRQPVSLVVEKYSLAYQNVQSSVGSTFMLL